MAFIETLTCSECGLDWMGVRHSIHPVCPSCENKKAEAEKETFIRELIGNSRVSTERRLALKIYELQKQIDELNARTVGLIKY